MKTNPLLKKLGFSDRDRLVILHADDIGMCQASIDAFRDLIDFGLISSGAVMVPCPWFPAAADYCRDNLQVDIGVHATLNCEYDTYRWGPISTREPSSGLIDAEGYFYRSVEEVQACAEPEAVRTEIRAQIQRALQAGMHPTHLDTHMGTIAHAKFIPAYVEVAVEHRLPPMIPRLDEAGYMARGMDAETAAYAVQYIDDLESQGLPLLDHLASLDLDQPQDRLEQTKALLNELPAGITHFILHPAKDTPELRAITTDWPSRTADYQIFTSAAMRKFIRDSGFQVIGYRALQDLM